MSNILITALKARGDVNGEIMLTNGEISHRCYSNLAREIFEYIDVLLTKTEEEMKRDGKEIEYPIVIDLKGVRSDVIKDVYEFIYAPSYQTISKSRETLEGVSSLIKLFDYLGVREQYLSMEVLISEFTETVTIESLPEAIKLAKTFDSTEKFEKQLVRKISRVLLDGITLENFSMFKSMAHDIKNPMIRVMFLAITKTLRIYEKQKKCAKGVFVGYISDELRDTVNLTLFKSYGTALGWGIIEDMLKKSLGIPKHEGPAPELLDR